MKEYSFRFPVEMMSRALGVSRGGYYKWLKFSYLKDVHAGLDQHIKVIFEKSRRTYGSPRVSAQLKASYREKRVSPATVARRMQVMGLVARPKRKYVNTTDSDHGLIASPNLLDRQFNVEQVNKVWVSDITYIATNKGWRYLTVILDLGDRSVVSWALSETMHSECTVIKAFLEAIKNRGISTESGLMFHSDRGVQYVCSDFRTILDEYKVVQSMSRKGNCWDNAVAESFFKTIKTEELYRYKVINANDLNTLIFRYIEGWYNTQRIHSALNGKTPWEAFYEKTFYHAA